MCFFEQEKSLKLWKMLGDTPAWALLGLSQVGKVRNLNYGHLEEGGCVAFQKMKL